MYTINLLVETLVLVYVSKYFQYDDLHFISSVMQFFFLFLINHLVRNILLCFKADPDQIKYFCLPDVKMETLKSYIVSKSARDSA